MSVVRYYFDEHIPHAVARGLRQQGVDVLLPNDCGMRGNSDEEVLAFATQQGRVVYTNDPDFTRLHATGQSHAGIVFAAQGIAIREAIDGLMEIYQVLTADEMTNQVRFL